MTAMNSSQSNSSQPRIARPGDRSRAGLLAGRVIWPRRRAETQEGETMRANKLATVEEHTLGIRATREIVILREEIAERE